MVKRISVVALFLLFSSGLSFPEPILAASVPSAGTRTDIEIQVRVDGGGPWVKAIPGGEINLGNGLAFNASPNAKAQAGAASLAIAVSPAGVKIDTKSDPPGEAGETDAQRNERVRQIMWDAYIHDQYGNIALKPENDLRIARADASGVKAQSGAHTAEDIGTPLGNWLEVRRNSKTSGGGALTVPAEDVGQFHVRQWTLAEASAQAQQFAWADAVSRGLISNVQLRNRFTAQFPTPPGFTPRLQLDWQVNDLNLKTVPTVAVAFVRHQVVVNDQPVGFAVRMKDGVVAREYFGPDAAVRDAMKDWFERYSLPIEDNVYKLLDGRPKMTIDLALDDALKQNGGVLPLTLENQNYAFSYESPPCANVKVKEEAGHKPNPTPNMHWNATSQTLTFDDVPINVLTQGGGGGIDPRYDSDPIRNAVLHIDPLVFALEDDGRKLFAGGQVSLNSDDGSITFLSASLPSLVLDESLYELQGLNLFGPLTDFTFNSAAGSLWLGDYLDRMYSGEALIPELFVGLDHRLLPSGEPDAFASDFDALARTSLSFCQPVPEPGVAVGLAGLVLGLAGIAVVRRPRRKATVCSFRAEREPTICSALRLTCS